MPPPGLSFFVRNFSREIYISVEYILLKIFLRMRVLKWILANFMVIDGYVKYYGNSNYTKYVIKEKWLDSNGNLILICDEE